MTQFMVEAMQDAQGRQGQEARQIAQIVSCFQPVMSIPDMRALTELLGNSAERLKKACDDFMEASNI